MTAPIFKVCAASPAVTALLGAGPTRLYPHGEAPEGTAKPYVVWQVVSGSPLNYINCVPSTDRYGLQVDVYADTASSADDVVVALRRVIAQQAYITGFGIDTRDKDTHSYRKGFDVAWLVSL
ncbi:DUF3168 domain-containing protein [Pseudomonas sp. ERGC3:05]|uniref:DUF3168 domain-containing protein n=1 Tax=Pseudomonas sp. 14P_5.3_Bac1 TaxID=2971622 RepID=UPI001C84DAE6|nr:DUF3168 domain-containing protein [Pseudomonas sp. 14P_5.3_Bac1]MBX7275484.1 DUF3168 domain-containing protein [Pseudomonas sp. ERGC3:01]MCU1780867.1 DUF3168 domain-containing protein [Pseudomonas sp. 14P_5.3_Bac1]QZC94291.1 DUF3168 domain-containing protein [Pseudomonas sp. ERGC3:05]